MMKASNQHMFLSRSLRRHLAVGVGAIAVFFGAIGGWAANSELSGAVIASGTLTVEGKPKLVQHPTGGVVAELRIKEGQQVDAGDILVRLDDTVTRANLAAVSANLNQFYAREARLVAERDGLEVVAIPNILEQRLGRRDAEAAMLSERRLFADRRTAREGQKQQLTEEIQQLREQIEGLTIQREAKDREIELIGKELVGTRHLFEMGLISLNRVNSLDRDSARITGERGQFVSQIAMTKGKIAETELKRIDIDQSMRAEVAQELRDVQAKQSELIEKEISALDELKRIDLAAPISGAVHELAIHTIGGVVKAGEDLMQIVPKTELTAEAKVAPQDIDQISLDQPATLRLTAFNRNTTPELHGVVIRISADLEMDEKTGTGYYRVAVAIPENERLRISKLTLVPGMPVETFIRTGDRTVLSYLLKPVQDHAARVFREE